MANIQHPVSVTFLGRAEAALRALYGERLCGPADNFIRFADLLGQAEEAWQALSRVPRKQRRRKGKGENDG